MSAGAPRSQPSNEHTPTPWEWDSGIVPPDGPERYCDIYVDGGDIIIANVNDCIPQGEANAALIVEAVNNHELLKQKLEFAEFEWNRATEGMKERDARIAQLERGLTWIVNSPSAHPANMVKVAGCALKPKAGS